MVPPPDTAPVTAASPAVVPLAPTTERAAFSVNLTNFAGPFDLLLSLIAKHQLDVTEIALAQVTDEFIAHIRSAQEQWNLDTASEFLVIAATLLDLKAARLLPTNDSEDPEDIELLEARDLLFARLLQYRAYKEIAAQISERLHLQAAYVPRSVMLEPRFAALLPDLIWSIGPDELAAIAARTLAPKPLPAGIDLAHLHAPAVSVREQAAILVDRLRRDGQSTFRALVADAANSLIVVGRFLALLELYRDAVVTFDQLAPLGELTVRWTGHDDTDDALTAVLTRGSDFDAENDTETDTTAGPGIDAHTDGHDRGRSDEPA